MRKVMFVSIAVCLALIVTAQNLYVDIHKYPKELTERRSGFGEGDGRKEERTYDIYYIVLGATPLSFGAKNFGHSFVIFGKEDRLNNMSVISAYGFYPDKKSMTGNGTLDDIFLLNGNSSPGTIKDEFANEIDNESHTFKNLRTQLTLRVDKEQYNAAKTTLNDWIKSKPDYVFRARDCISFVQAIGSNMGFEMPQRDAIITPEGYIKKLIAAIREPNKIETVDGKFVTAHPLGEYSYGSFIDGRFTGRKKEYFDQGASFTEADWDDGEIKGQCYTQYKNGDIYYRFDYTHESTYYFASNGAACEHYDSKKNKNSGTLTFQNGDEYTGQFINGIPNGQGSYRTNDGVSHYGYFVNGRLNGYTGIKGNSGTYYGPTIYGAPIGKGTWVYNDGSQYIGEFKNNQINGKGTYIDKKETWTGTFRNGFSYFIGTIKYANGDVYEGEAINGKRSSTGRYTVAPQNAQVQGGSRDSREQNGGIGKDRPVNDGGNRGSTKTDTYDRIEMSHVRDGKVVESRSERGGTKVRY